jgi:phenylalanine ammonia-lyase
LGYHQGENLTINEVVRVARYGAGVQLTDAPEVIKRLEASHDYVLAAAKLGNFIRPVITFYGNSLADRFAAHAEQFNQNINSQGLGSANLARQSLDAFHQYMAVALMFGTQAADLRTFQTMGHFDARATLSHASVRLYETVRAVVARPPSEGRPYIRNDNEQALAEHIRLIATDITAGGQILRSVKPFLDKLPLNSKPN